MRRSPYQDTMSEVRAILLEKGPLPLRAVFEHLINGATHHYSSPASMKSCVGASIRGKIEPDLALGKDGLVRWDADLCTKGEKYVRHIREWVERRIAYRPSP